MTETDWSWSWTLRMRRRTCSSCLSCSCPAGVELWHLAGSSQHSDRHMEKDISAHCQTFIEMHTWSVLSVIVFDWSNWLSLMAAAVWPHFEQTCYLGGWSQSAFSQQTGVDGAVADVRCDACRIRKQILSRLRPAGGTRGRAVLQSPHLKQEKKSF